MMKLTLTVQNQSKFDACPGTAQFEKWASAVFFEHKKQIEICIRLVDKVESAKLNEQYRNKTGPTNILSFNSLLPPDIADNFLLGDLVICAPIVAEEATELTYDIDAHWAHLTIHGCLHLLGYDHENEADANLMEQLETKLMASLGLPDPHID